MGKFYGGTSVSNVPSNFWKNWRLRWIYSEESIPNQWGLPVGYYSGWMLPRTAGYISGVNSLNLSLDSQGSAVSGINLDGTTSIVLQTLADLALIVSTVGTAWLTITTSSSIAWVLFGNWTASITISTSALIWAIQSMIASGSISVSGSSTIRADGYISGVITPFTELSPQNLANAVWSALASQYSDSTTMGGKLNLASSGWVDYDALGQAVWSVLSSEANIAGSVGEALWNTAKKGWTILNIDDISLIM